MKHQLRLLMLFVWLLLANAPLWAASYVPADLQMVRSVLERQRTLNQFHELALSHADSAAVRDLAKADMQQVSMARTTLIQVTINLGMVDADGLQPPGYFAAAVTRLNTLSGVDFDRQYLLLVLQCHAFLERSLNGQLRTGVQPELQSWIRQNIDAMEQQSRNVDHALYDLK